MYSASQASVVTGLPVKTIQKAIDTRALPVHISVESGSRRRYLSVADLICLELESRGLDRLPLAFRRSVFNEVLQQPRAKSIQRGESVVINVEIARKSVGAGLFRLRRAQQMVISNPEILGGTPVFRGTRVPVHLIASMVEAGVPVPEILESYPTITKEQVELSTVYAKAYPKLGRPPVQPWGEKDVVKRTRRRVTPSAKAYAAAD